jgi:hypothetical protein
LVHFMSIWYILCPFGTFYVHLVHFMSIWNMLWSIGIILTIFVRFNYKEKSGNPGCHGLHKSKTKLECGERLFLVIQIECISSCNSPRHRRSGFESPWGIGWKASSSRCCCVKLDLHG